MSPTAVSGAPGSGSAAELLLQWLETVGAEAGICSLDAAAALGLDHQALVGAVKSLQSLGQVIEAEQRSSKKWELTPEGQEIVQEGSHEVRVFNSIPLEGLVQSELMKLSSGKVGFSKAMSNKWIRLDKTTEDGPRIFRAVDSVQDLVREKLLQVQQGEVDSLEEKDKNELKKRKLLAEVTIKTYWIKKGNDFSTTVAKQETDLTPEMISSGSWRDLKFKAYNFEALGIMPDSGHLHPLLKVRSQFRQIFLEMGYRYDWKLEEARKNLLRTHTTAVSARMLYKLAQQEKFTPAKYFSIDRVFRNETLDATHLAEFHQIEGVVADYGLTLGDLMGVLNEFFTKLGISQLRFKPAYNPYTEPSMEVFSYHQGLKKWVEVGNSGVFRPEMLLPMGLPEGVSVIAWGLSLERPTMIKYGINNIRELVGHKVNLQMVYDSPLCRLDT
ncbi:hypothetical protein lerEdw1_002157 [Lerista edwardsae]|nr:hypothetical protein lerEdw1_002157 [Lerista edwardsae]